jgi:hypothetical protein
LVNEDPKDALLRNFTNELDNLKKQLADLTKDSNITLYDNVENVENGNHNFNSRNNKIPEIDRIKKENERLMEE